MRYFVPKFRVATLCGEQDKLISKVGGLPWGMPAELWPRCCGKPQKLLGQIVHDPPAVDLGEEAVLHLFLCYECGGIKEEGCAAFFVKRRDMGEGLVAVAGCDQEGAMGPAMNAEAFILGWEQREDGIPSERLADFYKDSAYRRVQEDFPDIDWLGCRAMTKAGGSPRWSGWGAMGFPLPPFEFLLQLDSYLFVDGPVPSADELDSIVTHYLPGSAQRDERPVEVKGRANAPWCVMHEEGADEWYFWWANLALDGTAYVFIDRSGHPANVKWFVNR